MMMLPTDSVRVVVLGSGTSQGVPMIGCQCPVCTSTDLRDKRTRCSLYLVTPQGALLIDTTPELRIQSLRESLDCVDAVLFTHGHADHIMGFDDLRRYCELAGGPLPIYGNEATLASLKNIFPYAFSSEPTVAGYVQVNPHLIQGPFCCLGLEITPMSLPHGSLESMGYLFSWHGRKLLAYLTDCAAVPESAQEVLQKVEVLIIDGLRDKPHPTHLNVSSAIAESERIQAGHTYLTHLAHDKMHVQRLAELPKGVELAYDGLKLEFAL